MSMGSGFKFQVSSNASMVYIQDTEKQTRRYGTRSPLARWRKHSTEGKGRMVCRRMAQFGIESEIDQQGAAFQVTVSVIRKQKHHELGRVEKSNPIPDLIN